MVAGSGWTLEAITTPGHCANHMAYALKETNSLFSGDHVMGWSTSIVAPPDGAMSDYMASLYKLAKRSETVYFPGHGNVIRDAPRFVQSYIRHRLGREESILHRLGKGATDIPTWCARSISGIDPRLDRCGRPLGAGASGGPGGARQGGDRRRALDRRDITAWATERGD